MIIQIFILAKLLHLAHVVEISWRSTSGIFGREKTFIVLRMRAPVRIFVYVMPMPSAWPSFDGCPTPHSWGILLMDTAFWTSQSSVTACFVREHSVM